MKKFKFVDVAFIVGLTLGIGPWLVFDEPSQYWLIASVVGGLLVAIAGYNAQARAVGMGEPGEDLLQQAWHWFRTKVLRQKVAALPPPEPVDAHQSIAPKPPRSALSQWALGIGLALVIAPTVLGWKVGNDWRMAFIAVGSVLIVASRRNLPPKNADDPPHGQELMQAAWAWLRNLFRHKP